VGFDRACDLAYYARMSEQKPTNFSDIFNTPGRTYRYDPAEAARLVGGTWDSPREDLRTALKRVTEQIYRDSNAQVQPHTQPLALIVSPARYQWAIDAGWIESDGTPTAQFASQYGFDQGKLFKLMREADLSADADSPHIVEKIL